MFVNQTSRYDMDTMVRQVCVFFLQFRNKEYYCTYYSFISCVYSCLLMFSALLRMCSHAASDFKRVEYISIERTTYLAIPTNMHSTGLIKLLLEKMRGKPVNRDQKRKLQISKP